MILDREAARFGYLDLPFLDLRVVELFHVTAFDADDVVVVPALLQLENGFTALEVMAYEKTGLLELREHAIHRGKAGVGAFLQQRLVHVLGREVTHRAFLEDFEDAQARGRRFEADGFEVSRRAQGENPRGR